MLFICAETLLRFIAVRFYEVADSLEPFRAASLCLAGFPVFDPAPGSEGAAGFARGGPCVRDRLATAACERGSSARHQHFGTDENGTIHALTRKI